MIDVFSKSIEEITKDDLQELIDKNVPEGDRIEFKQSLSTEGDSADPWMDRKGKIGSKAKDALVKVIVAFANAYGGTLLLGIRESESKPPVAAGFSPVPQCAELADRLTSVFLRRVEPLLTRLEIKPVKIDGEDGVVVIRVGQSRLAPHRDTRTRICHVRRSDRSEPMTMREIQDLTLNVSRGLERLEKRLSKRQELFKQEFECLNVPEIAVGVRATAVPVGDEIRFDRVFRQDSILEGLEEPWRDVCLLKKDGKVRALDARARVRKSFWRPILRAARGDSDSFFLNGGPIHNCNRPTYNIYREVHCDGLIELGFVSDRTYSETNDPYLPPDLPAILFANVIAQVHRVRNQAGVPMAEYAVEVEIYVKGVPATVGLPEAQYGEPLGRLKPGSTKFPPYPLGDSDEAHGLLNLSFRDFRNALGRDFDIEEGTLEIKGWPSRKADDGAEDAS